MSDSLTLNNQNIIHIYPEELKFFDKFLEHKGIEWKKEHKEASIVVFSRALTGYIRTPKRKIDIPPKFREITIEHIIRLYNYVYIYDGVQDDSLLDVNKSGKSENLVISFLNKLRNEMSIGILRDYSVRNIKNNFLKGQVDYKNTYKNIILQKKNPIISDVAVLSTDTPINKLIVGALEVIALSGEQMYESLELLGYFQNVIGIKKDATKFLNTINFNSNNIRYKKILADAAMIIDSLYYDGRKGENGGESFLINFDDLFERFIRKVLVEETDVKDFISLEANNTFAIEYSNEIEIGERTYKPDIVYKYQLEDPLHDYQPSAKAILDVKNKAYTTFKNADIYQIIMYNNLLYANKSILIYPSFFPKSSTILYIDNSRIINPDIHAVFIDIATMDSIGFKNAIMNLINEIYSILDN